MCNAAQEEMIETETLAQWYPLACLADVDTLPQTTMLLGRDVSYAAVGDGWSVRTNGTVLPARAQYGYLWTALADPVRDIAVIPEAEEPDRRLVCCGSIAVRTSGLRIVENFLDLAHFPFIHTDVLGAEPQTEVARYRIETRDDGAEIWAVDCTFFQPQAALSASGGIMTDYTYRVANPFSTLLYKTCPAAPGRQDVIALFVQPMTQTVCRAHPVMFLVDAASAQDGLVQFQQLIFLQDRIVLENQRPRLMPLDASTEIPTLADRSSVAYRRWLKARGVRYGAAA
ncbi:(2Fe-2S)-binding protein [Tanticharoenia sakaeratensis]|nr:(2Fe-2S)-binding protein [Tanticharoenia sakaeratensis]